MFTIIPADNFIWNRDDLIDYLVQHQKQRIVLSLNSEGTDCRVNGLYRLLDSFEFESVEIITSNILESHDKYKITKQPVLQYALVQSTVDEKYHTWTQQSVFGGFYGRPIWHRIGLASYLKTKHDNISLVNFRPPVDTEDNRKLFEMIELFQRAPEQFRDFGTILDQMPICLEEVSRYAPGYLSTSDYTDQLVNFYTSILVDVVAETFTSGQSFFPTEKTFRPMLLKKPFVIMAARNNLGYLKQMGFKTFGDFWDEDYDYHERTSRYQKILALIDHIAAKPIGELQDMYQRMQPILDHNYALLQSQSYSKNIELIK